ncbi:hypothetical protein A1QK_18410 [Vibrio genomosp. F10 str. 9ZD137]|nr:hypothetical protein A1QK_18410 [Vibrio genomosp. F10 str. 9ZD137]
MHNLPLSNYVNQEWGTFELESATGKNSIREAFGQFRFSETANLAKHQLLKVWQKSFMRVFLKISD